MIPIELRWAIGGAALCYALIGAAADPSFGPQRTLPSIRLNAGIHNIEAEVARTPKEHATGLKFRTHMGANNGMLFVFAQSTTQCFWMQDTLLPLSIAFLADDGTVVNVADMKPQTTDSHCSDQRVRFALEMNRGWFAKRGIKQGMKLQGPLFPN